MIAQKLLSCTTGFVTGKQLMTQDMVFAIHSNKTLCKYFKNKCDNVNQGIRNYTRDVSKGIIEYMEDEEMREEISHCLRLKKSFREHQKLNCNRENPRRYCVQTLLEACSLDLGHIKLDDNGDVDFERVATVGMEAIILSILNYTLVANCGQIKASDTQII